MFLIVVERMIVLIKKPEILEDVNLILWLISVFLILTGVLVVFSLKK